MLFVSEEALKKLGFVLASKYRVEIVRQLALSPMTPSQIARRTGIHISHVSLTLRDLAKENIVRCVNPERKKGRLYILTDTGKWIAKRVMMMKK
ncbi:MAG: ArsR family transcriptional regulator [Thermoprotei archaeon]|nr:MAG: ArsR family transcriptional regulator [Thermoprotei archaeon]